MRNGLTISTGTHIAVLAIGLFAFNDTRPLETQMQESVMIDLVSLEDVSRARAGQEKAPKTAPPKPMVEKVSEETKSQPDHTAKISEKPEIDTASNAPTPPMPQKREEPTPPTPPTPRKPPEPKRAEPEPKIDEMAKPEPKPEPKPKPKPEPEKTEKPKEEAKKPEPPKEAAEKPKQDAPKFDSNKIAALLDKRTPTRQAATGRELNTSPSLGTRTGTNARLSQTEIDALRAQIQKCWNPPVGAENAKDLVVRVRIALSPVGELQGEPILVNRGGSPYFQSAAESAMRAVRRCAPYNLPATKYDAWRDVEITFDPREMFRG